MKFNESLLTNKIKENFNEVSNDLDIDAKANAIVESLNFFDVERDWVEKINRDEIISLINNSKDQEALCESIIAKVNNTPFTKALKESKKKKESKKLNESLTKQPLKEDVEPSELEKLFGEFADNEFYLEKIGNGMYKYEITPYNDELELRDLKRYLVDVNSLNDFYEKIDEAYDYFSEYYRDIEDAFEKFLKKKGVEDIDDLTVQDLIQENVEIGVNYDYWLNAEYPCHIFIDNGDGNYDFSLNPSYSSDYTFDLEDEDVLNHASLIWVAQQQGYSPEELKKVLDGEETQSKFLKSVKNEVENTSGDLNLFAILCNATLGDVLRWNEHPTNITINKATSIGLFDALSGGGSILDVELEKPLTIPVDKIGEFWIDAGLRNYNGYDVNNVYGLTRQAYDADISFGTNESVSENLKESRYPQLDINFKEWYTKEYPNDELGKELNGEISLSDIYVFLKLYGGNGNDEYGDLYDYMGVGDSIVRERVFDKISTLLNVDYDVIYNLWLGKGEFKNYFGYGENLKESDYIGNAKIINSLDELPKVNDQYGYKDSYVISVDKTKSENGYDIYTVKSQEKEARDNKLGDDVDVATYTFAIKQENLKEYISSKDLKDNDILDILGIEGEQRKVQNTGSYIKQYRQLLDKGYDEPNFEIYLKGDEPYYRNLGKVVDNSKDLVVIDTHSKQENLEEALSPRDKDLADRLVANGTCDTKKQAREFVARMSKEDKEQMLNVEKEKARYNFLNDSLNKNQKENKSLKESDYYNYLDKDYAEFLDSDVNVYDVKALVEQETNGEYTTHYTDKYAIIVCANGKGCVVDYEAVGQDFDSVDSEIEFGVVKNNDNEYTDEQGVTHKTISLIATHSITTTPKEVMEKAPKKTMKVREFFSKYKYNDRCADNFQELAEYVEKNNGVQESCQSNKKGKKLKEGYYGQTLEDFFDDCIEPEMIDKVTLWGDNDIVYEGDYEGAIEQFGDNEFIEFDCGSDKVTINVDTSEEYQVTTYFVDVSDFIEFFNGDDIEVYDINTGETLFSGDKYDCPDEVLEKIFVSFDAPNYISINIEEDGDSDDAFDEKLSEALGKIQEVTKVVDANGNEFHVKPIWKTDRLATLVDKDGNQTKVEIADLRQYYDLYDQDDEIISRFEDNVDESLKEDWVKHFKNFDYYPNEDEDKFIVIKTDGNGKTLDKFEIDVTTYDDAKEYIKNNLLEKVVNEDTVKQNGKWVNKGNKGETHGEFKTKKEADKQRAAMFANKKPNAKWGK